MKLKTWIEIQLHDLRFLLLKSAYVFNVTITSKSPKNQLMISKPLRLMRHITECIIKMYPIMRLRVFLEDLMRGGLVGFEGRRLSDLSSH